MYEKQQIGTFESFEEMNKRNKKNYPIQYFFKRHIPAKLRRTRNKVNNAYWNF